MPVSLVSSTDIMALVILLMSEIKFVSFQTKQNLHMCCVCDQEMRTIGEIPLMSFTKDFCSCWQKMLFAECKYIQFSISHVLCIYHYQDEFNTMFYELHVQ